MTHKLTTLGGAEVLSRSRGARPSATSLFNAESAAFNLLSLQALLSGVGLVRCDHFNEAKATRLFGMGVAHDLALLNLTVFLEKAGDLRFGQTRVNTSDEEVRARVDRTIVITAFGASLIFVAAISPGAR